MRRPLRSGSSPHRLLGAAVALVACFALSVTCAAPRAQAVAGGQLAPERLTLTWAASEYGVREPAGAVVALHVVARNATGEATTSTAVRWSPEFARVYSFLESNPPAESVLIDGAGWGVVRVPGVAAGEAVEIGLWFGVADGVEPPTDDLFPRLQVLAEEAGAMGMREIGERLAVPVHAPERLRLRAQHAFDQSAVAQLAERAAFLPTTPSGVYGWAVGYAALLLVVTAAGVAAAWGRATRDPWPRTGPARGGA